jgi:tetratricopeptide (TPR) repeat protein
MPQVVNVFISHAHLDQRLAEAVRNLLVGVFGADVDVHFSSSPTHGGIPAGTEWREWILERVDTCQVAVVILTRDSLSNAWLMWEAGAILGVDRGRGQQRSLTPLLYGVQATDVMGPLQALQAESGETADGIGRLLEMVDGLVDRLLPDQLRDIKQARIPAYVAEVREAMHFRPMAQTAESVQEWCERLDEARRAGRFNQVNHLHRALLLAFGPTGDDLNDVLLDLRLHRRLGQLYLDAGQGREAVAQFKLALRHFPRDLFMLHQLGLAHLESDDNGQAIDVLGQIAELDADAVRENPEIAGLKGRAYRTRADIRNDEADRRTARDAYRDGLAAAPDSYYMAVNVGELSLALHEPDAAAKAYDTAKSIIQASGERTVWSLATLAYAALVEQGEDSQDALALLAEAGALSHSPREIDSIRRGLTRLQVLLGASAESYNTWVGALIGGAARAAHEEQF